MTSDLLTTFTAAAEALPAGGSEVRDIIILGGLMNLVIGLWIWLIISYRKGGAAWLRWISDKAEAITKIPGWAMVPGLSGIGGALMVIWGATWDIGLHIDIGRDGGPFGTLAHYPLLIGLEWMFLMGILAVVMAPTDPEKQSPAAFNIFGWHVPAGGLMMVAGGGFALLGFPMDDLWHRTFGQDVTLWGPTHTMFIGGVATAGGGSALLMIEGALVAGINPFRGRASWALNFGPLLAGIFLYFTTAILHEFNWGVPQYRDVWQPFFLALGGAFALVLARQLCGRGGAVRALIIWMPMQIAMMLVIGQVWDVTPPAMPLFIAQAAIVELLAIRGDWKNPIRFGLIAGGLVGTAGFAADYAWTQVGYPLPWQPGLIAEGLPVAFLAALGGGLLGVLMAEALRGRIALIPRALPIAIGAGVLVLGVAVNNVITDVPKDATATITVSNVRQEQVGHRGETATVGDVRVRLSRPEIARDGNWAYLLGWQGNGRTVSQLIEQTDGSFVGEDPVPISGNWKSFVRIQKGRVQLAAPVRMPKDAVIDFAGYPAPTNGDVTRTMMKDTQLLQIERKTDGPTWAWKPGFAFVILADLSLFVLMGFVSVRLGRLTPGAAAAASPPPPPVAEARQPIAA